MPETASAELELTQPLTHVNTQVKKNLSELKFSFAWVKLEPIMKDCWNFDPKQRPDFISLHHQISAIPSENENSFLPLKTSIQKQGNYYRVGHSESQENVMEDVALGDQELKVNANYNFIPKVKDSKTEAIN